MKTKASSATDMIKKLSDKGHVDYQKYKGVNLTDKGRLAAISVIRKHRLWEVFLVKKLNFSWDEVHEVAEQLEHIKSEKLINELDTFLDFPMKILTEIQFQTQKVKCQIQKEFYFQW